MTSFHLEKLCFVWIQEKAAFVLHEAFKPGKVAVNTMLRAA